MLREHAAEPHQNNQTAGEKRAERLERPPGRLYRQSSEPGVGEHSAAPSNLREERRDQPRSVRAEGAVRDRARGHQDLPGRDGQGALLAADRAGEAEGGSRSATTEVRCGAVSPHSGPFLDLMSRCGQNENKSIAM